MSADYAALDKMQRRRMDVLHEQWRELDRRHFETLMDRLDGDDERALTDEVAAIRRDMRANFHARQSLWQEADAQPVAALESVRIEALNHQVERSGYRISASPFLHTDRWWEPGYLDWDGHVE